MGSGMEPGLLRHAANQSEWRTMTVGKPGLPLTEVWDRNNMSTGQNVKNHQTDQ